MGKLNTTKEKSNYYDIVESPTSKVKDSNLIMIPKLNNNKDNKRIKFNELLEVAYNKLRNHSTHKDTINNEFENNFYHEIFYFYKNNNTCNLATKIYSIFPNVNFEYRQIKNLSFSNTNLNKYLINSKYKLPEMGNNNKENDENEFISGFFTMSQNHRLIALKDDLKEYGEINKSQSLKQIIVGIWINLKEKNESKINVDLMFNKHKFLIYKQCFKFINLSKNIETIYSPSPEENIFLLVIFYKGIQCHYEVKMNIANDGKKVSNNNENKILINNNNHWLINKFKYDIDEQKLKIPFDFDIKIEINNGKISTMYDYLNKKAKNNINRKEKIFKENLNSNSYNQNNNIKNDNIKNKQIKKYNEMNILSNTSSDVIDVSDYEGDSIFGGYNYSLAIQNINKNNSNNNIIKNNHIKNEHNISYKKQHEISRASTNAHSYKPSLASSKNSGKNNISNFDINNQINEEENNLNENSAELINQYTSTIMKNSESIKKLENQINFMEKNIIEIINQLENDEKNLNKGNKNNKIEKNKTKKDKNDKDKIFFYDTNNNNHDNSNIGDISINVPKIIYKDLSITKDD